MEQYQGAKLQFSMSLGVSKGPSVPSPECHTQGISKAVEYDANSENKDFGVTQILVQILSPSLTILGHSLGKWL